jgi:two-component system OmpR family sensor kinase
MPTVRRHNVADHAARTAGSPRLRGPRTLRVRLVVTIVLVIAAVCAVVGVSTEIYLGDYLVKQLDSQLLQIHQSATGPDHHGGSNASSCAASAGSSDPGGPPSFGFAQPIGALAATVQDAQVVSSGIVSTSNVGGCVALPPAASPVLAVVPADGRATTVTIPGVGDYRVVADMHDGTTVINGLPLSSVGDSLVQLGLILLVVTGIALLAGVVAVIWVVRLSLAPLDRVAATARRVSALPLDRGEVQLGVRVPLRDTDPRTEVGQVGAALNQMLGHVSSALAARQESETRVRQFVADASHELRTPLAAIRGYAELARRDPLDQQGVGHALHRVESESTRMTILVDDLLLLARLDSGRPLSSETVDVTRLAIDAVSDAQVAGPDHRWELDLPDDPVLTLGDEARLHQVLANLLANARTHTRPGTMVSCRLRATASTVVLTVTDNGAGIPDHLQPEIFHRFVRGDSSRSRAAGSTGLGLAIVAAVVAAHHGTVSVQSRPGLTSFTVELPMMQARSTAGDLTLEQALGASDRLGLGSPAPAG